VEVQAGHEEWPADCRAGASGCELSTVIENPR
jgi:hypothetical protein